MKSTSSFRLKMSLSHMEIEQSRFEELLRTKSVTTKTWFFLVKLLEFFSRKINNIKNLRNWSEIKHFGGNKTGLATISAHDQSQSQDWYWAKIKRFQTISEQTDW